MENKEPGWLIESLSWLTVEKFIDECIGKSKGRIQRYFEFVDLRDSYNSFVVQRTTYRKGKNWKSKEQVYLWGISLKVPRNSKDKLLSKYASPTFDLRRLFGGKLLELLSKEGLKEEEKGEEN